MKLLAKTKLWLILALIVVVAGVAVFSFLGFNQTADNKNAYEVHVGVDQNINGAADIAKENAESYFNEKGFKYDASLTQVYNDGTAYIYKFDKEIDLDAAALKTRIETALTQKGLGDLELVVTVGYDQTTFAPAVSVWKLVLACAIAVVAVFIVTAFINGFASAFTVVLNAIFALILQLALVALTRIPAFPTLMIGETVAIVLSMAFTFFIASKYKETLKAGDKTELAEIVESGNKKASGVLCWSLLFVLFAAVFIAVTLKTYFVYAGSQIAIAAIVAFLVATVSTPSLWKAFKSIKGRK